jgi:hypothetical protein
MQYKVSEIIKRALVLADIPNSQNLTYKDLNQYLNQAWRHLNQQIINHAIKYFYDEVDVGVGYNDLPWDFYQIDCIKTYNGYILPRHTNDMTDFDTSYDIIGNQLRIYNALGSVKMYYWKKPVTLTFPAKKREVVLPIDINSINVWDIYDNRLVYVLDNSVHVYNLKEDTDNVILDEGTAITKLVAGNGCFYLEAEADNISVKAISSYKGNLLDRSSNETSSYIKTEDNSVFISTYADNALSVHNWKSNETEDYTVYPVENTTDTVIFKGEVYTAANGNVYNISKETNNEVGKGTKLNVADWEDDIAILTDRQLIWTNNDKVFTEDLDIKNKVLNIIKADADTGYGMLTTDGTDFFIESWMPDTLLDFPSTVMYDFIAYYLAYLFALRLGLEVVNIEKALTQAESSFYDSIDNTGYYKTIIDVTGGGYSWLP